jgi:hypothetical protein
VLKGDVAAVKAGGRVRQTCLTCGSRYTVRQEQLDADCLYHLCRTCRERVKRAARKETASRG